MGEVQSITSPAAILDRAKSLVTGDRAETYGDSIELHSNVALMWSVILGVEVEASQVLLCMAALKIARAAANPNHTDNVVDGVGYLALFPEARDAELEAVEEGEY